MQSDNRQRLDKWLWHARMARTRTLAAKLVAEGYVRLNSQRANDPAKNVRTGDVLTLALAHATMVIKVQGFADRRGSAPEAQKLYSVLSLPDTAMSDTSDGAAMQKSATIKNNTTLAPDDECH